MKMEKKTKTFKIIFYLSAAFDTGYHDILIDSLKTCVDPALSWLLYPYLLKIT